MFFFLSLFSVVLPSVINDTLMCNYSIYTEIRVLYKAKVRRFETNTEGSKSDWW